MRTNPVTPPSSSRSSPARSSLSLCALALLSAACNAQSSNTLYGILDVSVGVATTQPATGASVRLLQQNPSSGPASILGFRGAEDLGDGMAALYTLEGSLAPDTGNAGSPSAPSGPNAPAASFFNRQAWVGLQRPGWGTLKLGRSMTPTIQAFIPGNSLPSGYNTGLVPAITAQGLNNDFYASNQIRYESPVFNGFSAQGLVALGEVPAGGKGGNISGVALRYDQDGLIATLARHSDRDAGGRHVNWTMAVAAYTWGRFRVSAVADRVNVDPQFQSGAATVYRDSKMVSLGGQYRAADALVLGLQQFQVKDSSSGATSRLTNLDARYFLSKRTALFLLVGRSKSSVLPVAAISGFAATANATQTAYSVGLNHSF